MEVLDGHLPDTQAGFRPARGRRDNVCALRWFIAMVLRRNIQAVFAAATGIVRVRLPSGVNVISEPFNIERGVLQGDIFSPVSFIAGLEKIFRIHGVANSGVVVDNGDSSVLMSKFEYADDAALIDGNTTLASARVTALAEGSLKDAAMVISVRKSNAMHVHRTRHVEATTEEYVGALTLAHKCESCGSEFTKQRGLKIHMARWCDGGRTQRSRRGSLTDTAVKTAKRHAAEATLDKVSIDDDIIENVLTFEYLRSRRQCDGDDLVDVRHRMDIAQAVFCSLSHLWTDHRLSRETKLRLYKLSVCSSLAHCCTAWALTRTVISMINGFNCRCLHVITGEDYRATATTPVYDLVLAVRKQRMRYLGHVLLLPPPL